MAIKSNRCPNCGANLVCEGVEKNVKCDACESIISLIDFDETAIKEDFEINDAIEDSIKSYFRNEITSIICVDSRDFIDELVREAKKLDAITDMAINKYKSFRKTFIGREYKFRRIN